MSCFSHSNLNAQQYLPSAEAAPGEDTLSFWDIPVLKKAYVDASPKNRMDGIPVGRLGVNGGDKTMILKLAEEMSEGKHGNFDGLLIAHKGQLLFEYYGLRGRINLPHPQASATKTYTSLALGRAIQMGYLTMADLDDAVLAGANLMGANLAGANLNDVVLQGADLTGATVAEDDAQGLVNAHQIRDALQRVVRQANVRRQVFVLVERGVALPEANFSEW